MNHQQQQYETLISKDDIVKFMADGWKPLEITGIYDEADECHVLIAFQDEHSKVDKTCERVCDAFTFIETGYFCFIVAKKFFEQY